MLRIETVEKYISEHFKISLSCDFPFVALTRSSICHLRFQLVALLLQGLDFTLLGEEEVGSHGLAHNQNAGQQGYTCHFVGTRGAAAEREGQEGRLFNSTSCLSAQGCSLRSTKSMKSAF